MAEHSHGIAALHQRIPFLLSQLGVHLAEDFVHRLKPFGVGPRTYAVLMALVADDGQSQRELSSRLGIHRNVMVTVIDSLEGQGLVKRTPHPADRRAFAVRLTDAGRDLLPTLDVQGRAQEDEITGPLTADERATLLILLQRMSTGLGLQPGVHPKLAQG
jgi:DNA-binding MarR family transcriptional regulator